MMLISSTMSILSTLSLRLLPLFLHQRFGGLHLGHLSIPNSPKITSSKYFPSSLRVNRPKLTMNSYFYKQIGFYT